MKSLEKKFNSTIKKNLNYSSYLCFAEAIRGQNFNRKTIRGWFNKLVEKDDYDGNEKKDIIRNLSELTNMSEHDQKSGQPAVLRPSILNSRQRCQGKH